MQVIPSVGHLTADRKTASSSQTHTSRRFSSGRHRAGRLFILTSHIDLLEFRIWSCALPAPCNFAAVQRHNGIHAIRKFQFAIGMLFLIFDSEGDPAAPLRLPAKSIVSQPQAYVVRCCREILRREGRVCDSKIVDGKRFGARFSAW